MNLIFRGFLGVLLVLSTSVGAQKPWEPTPRPDAWWVERHEYLSEYSQNYGTEIKAIFIGSSLIENWGREGLPIWNQRYEPVGAINYGIGGDKTENLLWRLQAGELDGTSPKVIVVYIGSNNIPTGSTSDEIVTGVLTVLSEIRRRLPDTKILYVATFPRLDTSDVDGIWNKITALNEAVFQVVDNVNIFGLNMFWDCRGSRTSMPIYDLSLCHTNTLPWVSATITQQYAQRNSQENDSSDLGYTTGVA